MGKHIIGCNNKALGKKKKKEAERRREGVMEMQFQMVKALSKK